MKAIFLLLLPALVCGEISVLVNFVSKPPIIDVRGHTYNLITDNEREIFKINDQQLKQAIANYTKETPRDVFVKKETRYNLHESFNWLELKRTVGARIKRVGDTKCEERNWTLPQGFVNVLTAFDTKTDFWTENIRYKYTVNHDYGKVNFVFSSGDDAMKKDRFSVPFKPAKLLKCEISFDLEYVAKLTGDVVVNYNYRRQGHFFWAFDIRNVQIYNGMPESEVRNAKMTIRYGKPLQDTIST